MKKQYYVYIMTNHQNSVFYTGVTNDLKQRVYQHQNKLAAGFTKRYHLNRLVYYEIFEDINSAITREKQIKAGSRTDKINLVDSLNRDRHDLYDEM